jgi:hypothetical protein
MTVDYHALARKAALEAGVDPDLYARLINQESGWDPNAVSPTGAIGLTQFLPSTAKDPGYGVAPLDDIHDPNEQLRGGAEYLKAMLDRYGGDTNKALAAYNGGAGNVDKGNYSSEMTNYVASINGPGHTPVAYSGLPAMPDPSEPGAGLPSAPKAYEPDNFDKLYGHLQSSGMGKAFGLQPDAFRAGSQGRNVLGAIMTGLGSMA